MVRVYSPDLLAYLKNEELLANYKGVICLANLITAAFPDSAESVTAADKKTTAETTIKSNGEAALATLTTTYDKVQKLTWYLSKNRPMYINEYCYIYPYFGLYDDGESFIKVEINYTDAQTNAGWIFFKKITFSVDGENTVKEFGYYDISRDNDSGDVWETADFAPTATDMVLLKEIANSKETIIRFEGDQYYYDHIVTQKEKDGILNVLLAYEYLTAYSK